MKLSEKTEYIAIEDRNLGHTGKFMFYDTRGEKGLFKSRRRKYKNTFETREVLHEDTRYITTIKL